MSPRHTHGPHRVAVVLAVVLGGCVPAVATAKGPVRIPAEIRPQHCQSGARSVVDDGPPREIVIGCRRLANGIEVLFTGSKSSANRNATCLRAAPEGDDEQAASCRAPRGGHLSRAQFPVLGDRLIFAGGWVLLGGMADPGTTEVRVLAAADEKRATFPAKSIHVGASLARSLNVRSGTVYWVVALPPTVATCRGITVVGIDETGRIDRTGLTKWVASGVELPGNRVCALQRRVARLLRTLLGGLSGLLDPLYGGPR